MDDNAIVHHGIWLSSINNIHKACSFDVDVRDASAMRVCGYVCSRCIWMQASMRECDDGASNVMIEVGITCV